MYGLIDCNNFYASCERLFRPELIGKPVVVLSNNDGCVISRSNEAKALGVPMGIPVFQIRDLIEKERITVCSSNYTLYGDLSNRVMSIIRDTMPYQEVYSIDECFVKVSPQEDLLHLGRHVRETVLRGTGIPISIGFAPTKTLAKIANHIAKKQVQYGGVFVLDEAYQTQETLKEVPIDDIWGIGRRNIKKMLAYQINTAYDLTQRSAQWVKKNFTIVGQDTYYELRGSERVGFCQNTPAKSIGRSRSFGDPICDKSELYTIVLEFADIVCNALQNKGLLANKVMVYLRTNKHDTQSSQYYPMAEVELGEPTDDLTHLAPVVKSLLDKIYSPGYLFKKAGILVSELEDAGSRLPFASEERDREISLQQLSSHLAEKYGRGTFFMAARDPSILKSIVRQEHLSPNYTTDISEILKITPTR